MSQNQQTERMQSIADHLRENHAGIEAASRIRDDLRDGVKPLESDVLRLEEFDAVDDDVHEWLIWNSVTEAERRRKDMDDDADTLPLW
jgi:hypothetical protein